MAAGSPWPQSNAGGFSGHMPLSALVGSGSCRKKAFLEAAIAHPLDRGAEAADVGMSLLVGQHEPVLSDDLTVVGRVLRLRQLFLEERVDGDVPEVSSVEQ